MSELVEPVVAPSRRRLLALEVFEIAAYRRYFVGLAFTMSGFWIRVAALSWFVYDLTHSKAALGQIAAASTLPWIVISPFSGVLADRADPRRVLQVVYGVVILANAGLATALLVGDVTYGAILAWTLLMGTLRGIENPTRSMLVRTVVGRDRLPSAIGMNAAGFHLTNALGYTTAGWLYAWHGPAAVFFVVAASTVPMLFIAGTMPVEPRDAAASRRSPWAELREGFRYVAGDRVVRNVIGGAFLLVLGVLSWRTLAPALIRDELGQDERGFGAIMALAGVGALAAALWVVLFRIDRAARVRRLFGLALAGATAVLAIAASPWPALTGGAVFVAGFCQVGFMATANTVVQETVPDALRGRVMGIWALMFGASYPLGGWILAMVAEVASTSFALGAFGAASLTLLLVASGIVGWRRFPQLPRRARRRPVPPLSPDGPGGTPDGH